MTRDLIWFAEFKVNEREAGRLAKGTFPVPGGDAEFNLCVLRESGQVGTHFSEEIVDTEFMDDEGGFLNLGLSRA